MNKSVYTQTQDSAWTGRVDSNTDPRVYRWHQVVNCTSLENLDDSSQFALLGFACDEGVSRNKGRIGSAGGPEYFRSSAGSLCWNIEEQGFLDVGTISPIKDKLEDAQIDLGRAVKSLLSHNKKPIIIGGGHETAFGHFFGISTFLKENEPEAKLGILNIDAHFDLRPYDQNASSGSPFLQALEHAFSAGLNLGYFVHGINPHNNTKSLFETADKWGVEFNTNQQVIKGDKSAKKKLQRFLDDRTHIYLTICLDVFDASIAPGVSAQAWHGIQIQHALDVIKLVKKSGKLISSDICELNPVYDQENKTAKLAGILVAELFQSI
jgi:formiminoglutamase